MTGLWIVRAGAHGEREFATIDQGRLLPSFNTYSELSDEVCAKLPLKQIWAPMAGV